MLSKSFKSLAFALLIIMTFSNAFIYASPVFEEKRDVDSLEKRATVKLGDAAFARFRSNNDNRVDGVTTFVQSFIGGRGLVVSLSAFNRGFVDPNVQNYQFIFVRGGSIIFVTPEFKG